VAARQNRCNTDKKARIVVSSGDKLHVVYLLLEPAYVMSCHFSVSLPCQLACLATEQHRGKNNMLLSLAYYRSAWVHKRIEYADNAKTISSLRAGITGENKEHWSIIID
jgi:hypothetical protein